MEEKSRTVDKVVELNQDQHSDAGMSARRPRKGIYLLPNILTTGALFGGFYAVLSALVDSTNGRQWLFSRQWFLMA